MRCTRPFRYEFGEYGCGQCMPCRVNKRREWTARIVLESYAHTENSFVTLTYSKESYPGQLVPRDLKLFLRRLRWRLSVGSIQQGLRYFAVGEYGDQTKRAHYHVALFGVGISKEPDIRAAWHCPDSDELLGWVHVGELNRHTAQYIAGYVCKKMTAKEDPRLAGMYPEFARMSLRPGIGQLAVATVAEQLSSAGALNAVASLGDVPKTIRVDGKLLPIGRYLSRQLREAMGWKPEAPQASRVARAIEYTAEDPAERERRRESGAASLVTRLKIQSQKRRI